MKKLLFAIVGMLFLAFAPTMVYATHDLPSCLPIVKAKENVATWDKTAVWEYLKEGDKFDKLMAWAKDKGPVPSVVDGILVSQATHPETGVKMVLWAISSDGLCVEKSTFQQMTPNEFDNIVGKGV